MEWGGECVCETGRGGEGGQGRSHNEACVCLTVGHGGWGGQSGGDGGVGQYCVVGLVRVGGGEAVFDGRLVGGARRGGAGAFYKLVSVVVY